MFDLEAFQTGALQFLLAFGTACLFTIAFKYIYQWTTPYEERRLIREGNVAAAVALGGALIGYALPVASALTQAHSLAEFAAWAVLAGVIQILVFLVVRRLVLADVSARIERGEVAVAIYLAAISISVGLINAASMTE
jgi:putative membrane protein